MNEFDILVDDIIMEENDVGPENFRTVSEYLKYSNELSLGRPVK